MFVEFVSDLSCGFVGFGVFVSFVLCALFVGLVSDFGVCGGADVFRAAARVPSKKFPKKFFKNNIKNGCKRKNKRVEYKP